MPGYWWASASTASRLQTTIRNRRAGNESGFPPRNLNPKPIAKFSSVAAFAIRVKVALCNCYLFPGVRSRPQSQPNRASRMALQQATATLPCQCRRSRLETPFSFRKGDRCERKNCRGTSRSYICRAGEMQCEGWQRRKGCCGPTDAGPCVAPPMQLEKGKKPDDATATATQQRSRPRSSPPRADVHVRQRWGNRQTHHAGGPGEHPAPVRGKTASAAAHALGTDGQRPWRVVWERKSQCGQSTRSQA